MCVTFNRDTIDCAIDQTVRELGTVEAVVIRWREWVWCTRLKHFPLHSILAPPLPLTVAQACRKKSLCNSLLKTPW